MNERIHKPVIRAFRILAAWMLIGLVPAILPGTTGPESTLTLKKAVEISLKMNPDLQLARNSFQSSEINVKQRRNAFLPNLTITSSGNHQAGKSVDPVSGDYTASAYNRFSLNASSSLTLFDGFSNSSSYRQAREKREAASADLSRTRQDVVYRVVQQFLKSVTARSFVGVERENLKAQQELLKQVSAFYKAGRKPKADFYQQQAQIASAEYQLQEADRARQVAVITLQQYLGMDPDPTMNLAEPRVKEMVEQLRKSLIEGKPDEGETPNRADITAQERRVAAARQGIRSARSGFYPQLSASAGVGSSYSSSIADADLGDQLLDRNLSASFSLNLSIPVFDKGQTRQNVAAARIELNNEELNLESQRRQAAAEIREAWLNWENAFRQLTSATTQLKYAKAALDSLEERYTGNDSTLAEVSQSRAQYREARYNHVAADYNLLLCGLEILYSRGDGQTLTAVVTESPENPAAESAAQGEVE